MLISLYSPTIIPSSEDGHWPYKNLILRWNSKRDLPIHLQMTYIIYILYHACKYPQNHHLLLLVYTRYHLASVAILFTGDIPKLLDIEKKHQDKISTIKFSSYKIDWIFIITLQFRSLLPVFCSAVCERCKELISLQYSVNASKPHIQNSRNQFARITW